MNNFRNKNDQHDIGNETGGIKRGGSEDRDSRNGSELGDFDDLNELHARLNEENHSSNGQSLPLNEQEAERKLEEIYNRRESIMLQMNEEEALGKLNAVLMAAAGGLDREASLTDSRLEFSDGKSSKADRTIKSSDVELESPLNEVQSKAKLDELFGGRAHEKIIDSNSSLSDDSKSDGGNDDMIDEFFARHKKSQLQQLDNELNTPLSASYQNLGGIVVEMMEAEGAKAPHTTQLVIRDVLEKSAFPSTPHQNALSSLVKDEKPFVMNMGPVPVKK
jgi:hypothetical protein